MIFYIVIPAHNEEDFILLTLQSLANQSLLPKQVVVVNDNSTDNTQTVVNKFSKTHSWVTLINKKSSQDHLPGSKVVNAFYKGFEVLDDYYDVICKFDADLIFPKQYLEQLSIHFKENKKLGLVSGLCYIKKNGIWILENLTKKKHIRGGLKAYRKNCFLEIGKLKPSMGWDTIDELLALYYGWETKTDNTLKVKHLKPTGQSYSKESKYFQGEAFYKMRLGPILTFLSTVKLAYRKKKIHFFIDYLRGYFKAMYNKTEYIVTREEGKFIRKYRWKGIIKKITSLLPMLMWACLSTFLNKGLNFFF